jgi:hypothetical protein
MITSKRSWLLAGLLGTAAAAVAFASPHARETKPVEKPKHDVPAAKNGGTVVELCDGETTVEVTGDMTPEKARAASAELMRQWRAKNPDALWDDKVVVAQAAKQGPAGAPAGVKPSKQTGVYSQYTSRDEKIWAEETAKFIDQGNKIFHDAKALGGTVAISCDMCHPNAANTHPETYPKFQVQLGKVALLRDMINWCIENPVKGKPMADDDPKLRALEAYILAQRKGVPLEYGKH